MVRAAKKKVEPRRIRTGFDAAPTNDFIHFMNHIRTDIDKSKWNKVVMDYFAKNLSKEDFRKAKACPDWITSSHSAAAVIYWKKIGKDFLPGATGRFAYDGEKKLREFKAEVLRAGETKLKEAAAARKKAPPKPPMTANYKMLTTVCVDFDDWMDDWLIHGKESPFDMKGTIGKHTPSAPVIKEFRERILEYKEEIARALDRKNEEYVGLHKSLVRRFIKEIDVALSGLETKVATSKATRAPRKKKPVTADKVVAGLSYKARDDEYDLISIDPTQLVGAKRFYTFHPASRVLTEYVSANEKGFSFKGCAILNYDKEKSRNVRLRKPEQFLITALKGLPSKVNNEWKQLTTKTGTPNGRFNKEMVILRALNK